MIAQADQVVSALTTSEAELDHAWNKRESTLYRAELSALYHQKRERFFELADKLGKAVSVIGGSAALWKIGNPRALAGLALLITTTSSFSLVFSFSDRSKRHSELAKSFRELIAKITSTSDFGVTDVLSTAWASELHSLEVKEPPSLAALTIMCQNELAIARGEHSKVKRQGFIVRQLAHFFDMPETYAPPQEVASASGGIPADSTL